MVDETGATLWSKKIANDESAILAAVGEILELADETPRSLVFNCRWFLEEPSPLVTCCDRQRRIGSRPPPVSLKEAAGGLVVVAQSIDQSPPVRRPTGLRWPDLGT